MLLEKFSIQYMQAFGHRYPDCGFSRAFFQWIVSDNPRPYKSFGNGAAMRISPIAYVGRTEKEIQRLSETITGVSHNHAEGLKGAEATVPQAIVAFLESTSFEDAVRNAVSLGGDSDTLAAIADAMAEAHYGIPEDIKKRALSYFDERQLSMYEEWILFIKIKNE